MKHRRWINWFLIFRTTDGIIVMAAEKLKCRFGRITTVFWPRLKNVLIFDLKFSHENANRNRTRFVQVEKTEIAPFIVKKCRFNDSIMRNKRECQIWIFNGKSCEWLISTPKRTCGLFWYVRRNFSKKKKVSINAESELVRSWKNRWVGKVFSFSRDRYYVGVVFFRWNLKLFYIFFKVNKKVVSPLENSRLCSVSIETFDHKENDSCVKILKREVRHLSKRIIF